MKRVLFLILSMVIMANMAACGSSLSGTAVKSPVYPKGISFDDYDSRRAVKEENPIDKGYINAVKEFSYKSAAKILNGKSENICYSPASIYMALSLAGTGAEGITQDEIYSALGVKGKGTDYLSKQNGNLFRLMYTDNEIGKLRIANSLWLQKDVAFKDSFTSNAVENFYASLHNVDFSDDSTPQHMSKWISDNTNGILSPEIEISPEQIMSIINTIYFKDEWVDRFNEDNTKSDTFYLNDGSQVECDFMNATFSTHGFVKGEGFTSSSLSLKNSGSMVFILPDKGVGIDDLISTPEKTASLFDNQNRENGKVIFKIPKFSYGSDLDLNEMLKSMGITSAFKENADFTGITDGMAYISKVKQQTHIAIDEKGVEAAAFTQIDYCGSAPPKDRVAEMILDRPFIFAITSNTGTLLFIGVVNNPADK